MAVFTMDSDKHFIRKSHPNPNTILVLEYEERTNIFDMVRATYPHWKTVATIVTTTPPKDQSSGDPVNTYSALKIFGVTIAGLSLTTLIRDLVLTVEGDRKLYLAVNRRGVCHCLVNAAGQPDPVKWMKIDGHFCWPKYGVFCPEGVVKRENEEDEEKKQMEKDHTMSR